MLLISGAANGPQAEPQGVAQSIAPPPPSDVRIKLIKAEVEEQWGGESEHTQRAPFTTVLRHHPKCNCLQLKRAPMMCARHLQGSAGCEM